MAPVLQCPLIHGGAMVLLALALVASPRCVGDAEASEPADWHVVGVSALLPSPSAVCAASKAASNSSVLDVVHQHGPCSPLHARGHGRAPSHTEILAGDQARLNSIHRKIAATSAVVGVAHHASKSKGVSASTLPVERGVSVDTNNYIMAVGLGTPAKALLVELDTGSDVSWVQCKPCAAAACYEQKDPLFDPASSSTYSAVPCGAPECRELESKSCSPENRCRYELAYGDHSHAGGSLARDTLALTPSDELPGFVFGCGDEDAGTFARTDGLFGLGRHRVSLASQAAAKYGAGFSYCLPSSSSARGYLSLGGGIPAPANARFTAMVTRADLPSLYYLDLVGVKVAGRAVKTISPAVFATAGTIIDSGTVFTYLPPAAYAALRSAFTRAMAMGGYKRAPRLPYLDTCYDLAGHTAVRIPSVALVFAGGATLSLDASGVMYMASNLSQMCLGFASNRDEASVAVIGNMQQRKFAVVYDVANQRIGFGAKGCS